MGALVVVPHIENGLRPEVSYAIRQQWRGACYLLTPYREPFAYTDLWRSLWRMNNDTIMCEQDVIPPANALDELVDCDAPWCTHPHWGGTHYMSETFGLVKVSRDLKEAYPNLMDRIATPLDSRYWVRRGWTHLPCDCSPSILNSVGRRVCLRFDAPPESQAEEYRERPSSHGWFSLDTTFAHAMHALGFSPHVHRRPTIHLHDYKSHPAGSARQWWQMGYDEIDWPG